MSQTPIRLLDKFFFGHSPWPSAPFHFENTSSIGKAAQLSKFAEFQLDLQKTTVEQLVANQDKSSQLIAKEINIQSEKLKSSIDDLNVAVTQSIVSLGEQVEKSLENLGNMICASLSEIKWELVQQTESLSMILKTLQNSRNVEARQLVKQGVRHYVHGEYEEAEDRFRKALEFDSTDYQVLSNLGFISLQNDLLDDAIVFFRKAVTLPESNDFFLQAKGLSTLARLNYLKGEYSDAYSYSLEAISHFEKYIHWNEENRPRPLDPEYRHFVSRLLSSIQECGTERFQVSIYAHMTGDLQATLELLRKAISRRSTFFSVAMLYPDFSSIRPEISNLLCEIDSSYRNQLCSRLSKFIENLEAIDVRTNVSKRRVADCRNHIVNIKNQVSENSYSENLSLNSSLDKMEEIYSLLVDIAFSEQKRAIIRDSIRDLEGRIPTLEKEYSSIKVRKAFNDSNFLNGWGCASSFPALFVSCGACNKVNEVNQLNQLIVFVTTFIFIYIVVFFLPSMIISKYNNKVESKRRKKEKLGEELRFTQEQLQGDQKSIDREFRNISEKNTKIDKIYSDLNLQH